MTNPTINRRALLAIGALSAAAVMVTAPAFAQQSAPKPQTLFTNVNVFDGLSEKRIMNANVLVEGNLIKRISTTKIDTPGATVINGGGRTLMPGCLGPLKLDHQSAANGGAWDGSEAVFGRGLPEYLAAS